VTEIVPGVYSIGQRKGGHVHAFLLEDDDGLTLIDTLYDTDARLILDLMKRMKRKAEYLKRILLTHAHRSHLGGLATLKDLSGAKVHCHSLEKDIVEGKRTAQPVPILPMRPVRDYWPVYHLQLGAALGLGKHPPCKVDNLLEDRQRLEGGGRLGDIEVIHTPGHSPGHCAFYLPKHKVLFAGDAIATYPVFAPGWPAFTLNPEQHRKSLNKMAELDAEVVAVGHGEHIGGANTYMRSLVQSASR
jgi:glyoxylase-like metal-dependent hydrolase (beta-lactamase superfamily II)